MSKNHVARRTHGSPPNGGQSAELRTLAQARHALAIGELQRAGELSDAVLVLSPQDPDALHLGGAVALQMGRIEVAIARLRRAATLRPRDAAILVDFGRAFEAAGQRGDAEMVYRAALMMQADFPDALSHLARLLGLMARDAESAELYERLIARQPSRAEAHAELAQLRLKLRLPLRALESARRALAAQPRMIVAMAIEAEALDMLGRLEEAIIARERAIKLDPDGAAGYFNLANTQMHYGKLDDAARNYREAIKRAPEVGELHRSLSFVVGHPSRDAEVEAMAKLHRSNSISDDDRMHLCFGLGKALDELQEFEEAFGYFLEGNRLKRARLNYSSAETDRLFDTVKSVFTPERFAALAGSGSPDPTPIFVLGMPRSSTSLVEQVLAAHPDVQGGGEFRLVNQLVGSIADGPGFPIGEALDNIDPAGLRDLGEQYIAHVRGLSGSARFITDKLPGNFIMIGMIKLMLPNARIIHCRRDPVDNCLSIFKNYFAAEHLRYAYDLREIGHYYTRYLDLMAHWHRVLPGFVHDVDYETLVADFDTEARQLVNFCGLEWRDECRTYYTARRPVETASAVQVRKPIYKSSIGQRDRYGARLAPLLEALRA